ncbi:hypothetical protein ABZ318_25305, partial [Streptomyces sp. NPDC006197]|uniref:hypothetical protein n=1 Tax=Streptomyces sp. NPDC006197 TaxID=3156685 RepID=UPI0033A1894E
MATALAWAVPITVRTLCWLNTRSTATSSGEKRSSRPAAFGLGLDGDPFARLSGEVLAEDGERADR